MLKTIETKFDGFIDSSNVNGLIAKYDLPDNLMAKNYSKADVIKAKMRTKDEQKSLENLKEMCKQFTEMRKILVEKMKVLAQHFKEGFESEYQMKVICADVAKAYNSFRVLEASLFKDLDNDARENSQAVSTIRRYSSQFS